MNKSKEMAIEFSWRTFVGVFSLIMILISIPSLIVFGGGIVSIIVIVAYALFTNKTLRKKEMLTKGEKIAFIVLVVITFIIPFFVGFIE